MKKLLLIATLLLLGTAYGQTVTIPCGSTATPIASGITTTTFTDSAVTDGVTYYYTVAAVSTTTGLYSSCPTPVAAPIPATGTHSVTLNWTASTTSGVTYAVFRASPPNPPTGLTETTN